VQLEGSAPADLRVTTMATQYEAVIGLEVHAQLATRTKMFCGCSTSFGAAPNTNVCPVCLGMPGALPVPNRSAIDLAVRAGLSLGCTVRGTSRFSRKNYFYPDLSKGYQISQFDLPLNEKGSLAIDANGTKKTVGIIRIHVEEDAAKNLHGVSTDATLVDFNRAGSPLIETVSAPDMRSADEAVAYLTALRDIFMFAGVNDGNLEEGSFRCDANVSIRPVGTEKLGTRTELKNINSFKFVKKAIELEIARQEAVLSAGGTIVQETRGYSDVRGETFSMRSKEEAHDYRYFDDPDLPPLTVDDAWLARVKKELPERPDAMRARWREQYGITDYDAHVLTGHPRIAAFFERVCGELGAKQAKKVANFVMAELLGHVATNGLEATFPITEGALALLLTLVENGTINGKIAKDVLAKMIATGRGAKQIVDADGLAQVTDTGAIEKSIRDVVTSHGKELAAFKAGKVALKGFFVGQVMRATKGQANPALVNEILDRVLAE
jgi:aspartyl-tRNA(Asn)/glutamyl-tRNA(Gln) amidotransferase subunit B